MAEVAVDIPGAEPIIIDDSALDRFRERLAGARPHWTRTAFAAAHVAMQPNYSTVDHTLERPGAPDAIAQYIDWEATTALRARLDRLGFGIAEAMDTAQRFQLGWPSASQLIERCGELAPRHAFIAGAGVDHLPAIGDEDALVSGVVEQARFIQRHGGSVILLPLDWLCVQEYDADDFVRVYTSIIDALDGPLCVHWLGAMFAPALAGYFPGDSFDRVMAHDPAKVRGCKLSLLDADFEVRVRRRLRECGQVVLTGDDFNFARLLLGGDAKGDTPALPVVDGEGSFGGLPLAFGDFSHALLGILDGIAAPASVALDLLATGDRDRYIELMEPCERLGRHVFQAPTMHYKVGLAFLSWLDGWQPNPMLVNHEERARSYEHLIELVRLAAEARVFEHASIVARRLANFIEDRSH